MQLMQILEKYSDDAIDRLAADKVEEIANLRLPRTVLLQEIVGALSSLSYVAQALAPARPPTYSFLKQLLDASDHALAVEGFREVVMSSTRRLAEQASELRGLAAGKNYSLYLHVLRVAWENNGHIDRSEALLLSALREELGIWTREHLLLEHHPDIRPLWNQPRTFDRARNHLLTTGLVLTHGDRYVVAEEVCQQIRRVWDMELEDGPYARLLARLTGTQLRSALETFGLVLSGVKEQRIQRLIEALVPPGEVLDTLHISVVKNLCRGCDLPVSAPKADLIAALIEHFDAGLDLAPEPQDQSESKAPPAPEPRELDPDELARLLDQLSLDHLYDILANRGLRRSGNKPKRIQRLVESPFSERTLLGILRRRDLVRTCRKLSVQVSGVKDELIERLIEWASAPPEATEEMERSPGAVADEGEPPAPGPDEVVDIARVPRSSRPQPPARLRDIEREFPDLAREEQVILALIREARSLTERDIERAAARHGIGWFLTKAHMAELFARLAQMDSNPVRIRSTGGTNIYEWHGGRNTSDTLDRVAARDVIDALRHGVVPERHLDLLVVGQEAARQHLSTQLDHVRSRRSDFKFLRGPYGSGKTFLTAWLREQAFDRGFAVATVRIGPDQPLSDLPVFYAGLVSGLRTPEKRDATALPDILESWLLDVHRRTAQVEGLNPYSRDDRRTLQPIVERRIDEDLDRMARHDAGFAPAIRAFYRARLEGNAELAAIALAWLRGSSAVSSDALRQIGVRGQLEPEQVFPRIRALLDLVTGGRLQGLLLVVDELELVRRFPHSRQRERAYETLRLLIDETGENGLPGCLLVFTATDALFNDARYGLGSYQALENRISPPRGVDGIVSMRQPVIQLEGLGSDRLRAVARRVREIHQRAYGWEAAYRVPDDILARMVDEWTAFGGERVDRLPRPFLREVVHLLDLCEENPSVRAEECLRRPETQEVAASVLELADL